MIQLKINSVYLWVLGLRMIIIFFLVPQNSRSCATFVIIRKPINVILNDAVGYAQHFCYQSCVTKHKKTHTLSQLAPYKYSS